MAGSEFDYYGLNQSVAEVSLQKELASTFHYNVRLDMMHVTTQGYEGSVCDMFGFGASAWLPPLGCAAHTPTALCSRAHPRAVLSRPGRAVPAAA